MEIENTSNEIIQGFLTKYKFLLNLVYKGTTNEFRDDFFRVRIANKDERIELPEQLSYPKLTVSASRCNFTNDPKFYCSDKATTAIAEILKYKNPLDQYLYLSVWKFKPERNIYLFPLLQKAKQKGLIDNIDILDVIPDKQKRRLAEKQIIEIERYFYDRDHAKSASISHILFSNKMTLCDCIVYPSVIESETGINISMKPEFVDSVLTFERAYKFELYGEAGNYETELLEYTLSKTNFIWKRPRFDEPIFRTLLKSDLGV